MPGDFGKRVALRLCCSAIALTLGAGAAGAQGLLDRIQDPAAPVAPVTPAQPADPYGPEDDAAFRSIEGGQDPKQFEQFLARFPDSPYVPRARSQLAELERTAAAAQAEAQCTAAWPIVQNSCERPVIEAFVANCAASPNIRKARTRLTGFNIVCAGKIGTPGTPPAQTATAAPATGAATGSGSLGGSVTPPAATTAAVTPPASSAAGDGGTGAASGVETQQFGVEPHSQTYYVRQNSNLRAGPGTTFGRKGGLAAGAKIEANGRTSSGWIRFSQNGEQMFIFGRLLQTSPVRVARRPAAGGDQGSGSGSASYRQYREPQSSGEQSKGGGSGSTGYRQYRGPADAQQKGSSGTGFKFSDLLKNSRQFEPFADGDGAGRGAGD